MSTSSLTLAAAHQQTVPPTPAPARPQPRAQIGSQALLRRLQPKLTVGAIDDPLEAEADKVADLVMRQEDPAVSLTHAPPSVSRKCAECEEEDKQRLRAKSAGGDLAGAEAPTSVTEALATPGQALDPTLRDWFEPRFGADLSSVRIHLDSTAARSATELGAFAYTVGPEIVFAPGAYEPATESGQRLIAQEFTHVLQQQSAPTVRREPDPAAPTPQTPAPQAPGAADAGAGPADGRAGTAPAAADPDYSCQSTDPVCPPEYCQDIGKERAEADRASKGEGLLGDIRLLNSRAEPLFRQFIFNPGPAGDISSTYAEDFTHATETGRTTEAFTRELEARLKANPPASIPPGGAGTVDLTSVLTPRAITQFMECHLLFADYTSVPGLIAGGVGKTQETDKRGKNTEGAINDARGASGTLMVTRNTDGSISIAPSLTYRVVDTLDFCPGNCGGGMAQRLTIPLSQWEASGISGDVPFSVNFPAPSQIGAYDDSE